MADDVRCTHGATTSTLEPSHLYYLLLTRPQPRRKRES